MSRTDLHPDHLLARRRAGLLTAEESALLDRHAAACATCAFELAAAQDFDRDLAAPVDDAALVAATALAAALGVDRSPQAAVAPARPAAARPLPSRPSPTPTPTPTSLAPASPTPAAAPSLAADAPSPATPAVPSPSPAEPEARRHRRHARHHHAADAGPVVDDGARALFEQAVTARREGQLALAASLFERLQQRYGDSEEASISQIALGRLWLDRLGQPSRALAQFESYLAARRRGESREEAMVGRAAALERLGRTASAREAWEAVRDTFPGSVSARRAALRIDALR